MSKNLPAPEATVKKNLTVQHKSRQTKESRRSLRLKGYDYSQAGAYFVTICTQNRACLFGHIADGQMVLNEYGKIVRDEWLKSSEIRNEIELDEFVVMPNHFHGIAWIVGVHEKCHNAVLGAHGRAPLRREPRSLGSLTAGFKSAVTKRINEIRRTPGVKLWQRNYYEHVIRDENELNSVREYIINNPAQWDTDRENPDIRADGQNHETTLKHPCRGARLCAPTS